MHIIWTRSIMINKCISYGQEDDPLYGNDKVNAYHMDKKMIHYMVMIK